MEATQQKTKKKTVRQPDVWLPHEEEVRIAGDTDGEIPFCWKNPLNTTNKKSLRRAMKEINEE